MTGAWVGLATGPAKPLPIPAKRLLDSEEPAPDSAGAPLCGNTVSGVSGRQVWTVGIGVGTAADHDVDVALAQVGRDHEVRGVWGLHDVAGRTHQVEGAAGVTHQV